MEKHHALGFADKSVLRRNIRQLHTGWGIQRFPPTNVCIDTQQCAALTEPPGFTQTICVPYYPSDITASNFQPSLVQVHPLPSPILSILCEASLWSRAILSCTLECTVRQLMIHQPKDYTFPTFPGPTHSSHKGTGQGHPLGCHFGHSHVLWQSWECWKASLHPSECSSKSAHRT